MNLKPIKAKLIYRGVLGDIKYSPEDKIFFGHLENIPNNISASFEGESIPDICKDFEAAVDDYLDVSNKTE